MRRSSVLLTCGLFLIAGGASGATPQWQALPPTPVLPKPPAEGMAPVNGIRLHYEEFGRGQPVILLHGGLANMNYWANQVPILAQHYHVVLVDSRGHGRSTRSGAPYSYELMASDVVALMDFLKLPKAAIVGWSDGGITGLELAIHHADRVTGVFAFAANYNPDGVKPDLDKNPVFGAFITRCGEEYKTLSATPDRYDDFLSAITTMWATEPNIPEDTLRHVAVPVVIADGDHDEAIRREQTEAMAALIPGAGLLILPNTSHFSMLQDPEQFSDAIGDFLRHVEPG